MAAAVGTATFASGISATAALLVFFFSSAVIGRLVRTSRVAGPLVEEQSRPRDAYQVLAVGALPALAALCSKFTGESGWLWGCFGALAFATADTWATEWGQSYPGSPRLLAFGREVPPGLSGGVTLRGTLAGLGGAVLIAAVGVVVCGGGWREWLGVTAVGWSGSVLDSILGASIQARGSCSVCGRITERAKHCGSRTVWQRRGLSNEAVNLVVSGVSVWLGWVLLR